MEKTIGVSEARQNLMKLTRHIADNMDRLVLTNKGRAETVLLSLAEYQSLKAAAELATHPEILKDAHKGFAELEQGQGILLTDALGQATEIRTPPADFRYTGRKKFLRNPARQSAQKAGPDRKFEAASKPENKSFQGPFIGRHMVVNVDALNMSNEKKTIRPLPRESTIQPEMVGHTIAVHNGRKFIPVYCTEKMVGQKLGEFSRTRTLKARPAKSVYGLPGAEKKGI